MNLRDALDEVRKDYGRLTGENCVAAWSDPSHPCHTRLEWDDTVAGHAYRVLQANEIIRRVTVKYGPTRRNGQPRLVRAFVSLPDSEGRAYLPAEEVALDPQLRAIALRDMEREWKQLKARYAHFAEFAAMVLRDLGEEEAA